MKPKPLVPWYGGKARMAKIIAASLPPHKIYVEPFGGAAGVLMAKEPSFIEVYNDLHNGIVTLFKVVRDPLLCRQLEQLLELTPYARTEWEDCNENWELATDPVEMARQVYVFLSQNFVGVTKHGSWSFGGPKHDGNVAQTFYRGLENIKPVARRLQSVQIECRPAMEVIDRWDGPDTLFYLDPPYLPETRSTKHKRKLGVSHDYAHELTREDHIELIDRCLASPARIILSGYQSPLYTEKLEANGWRREDYTSTSSAALVTRRNGRKEIPDAVDKARRTESLWFNLAAQRKTLFDFAGQAG